MKVSVSKTFFGKEQLDYLGYTISKKRISPITKKVDAIRKIVPPKTRKQLQSFLGMVNYYRDMWIRQSHVLALLTRLQSKDVKFTWDKQSQEAFDTIKRIMQKEVLLAYPDFSKPFEIHTDASHTQLGAVIAQEGQPIVFYSRKLSSAQTRYTTTERELLAIVETLKEFRNILLGYKIKVYTDHKKPYS